MALRIQFLAETDRRRSTTPFCDSFDEWWDSLPGYTQNQVQTVGVWKLKVRR